VSPPAVGSLRASVIRPRGMSRLAKNLSYVPFLVLALPAAAIAGFGRFATGFSFSAQACALIPGIVGDYLRIAFYKLTLKQCSFYSRISFGSFFAHPDAMLGRGVYIGPYCILGCCSIGDRTQIAAQVQVLSGRRQHRRDEGGQISGSAEGEFQTIDIGADCWIGASSIIMAPIGYGSIIGAGSVVVRPIGAQAVAVGNPARVVKEALPGLKANGVSK
jgi:virginiamycin A acetyltransferase